MPEFGSVAGVCVGVCVCVCVCVMCTPTHSYTHTHTHTVGGIPSTRSARQPPFKILKMHQLCNLECNMLNLVHGFYFSKEI